jgi:hypothetical protein
MIENLNKYAINVILIVNDDETWIQYCSIQMGLQLNSVNGSFTFVYDLRSHRVTDISAIYVYFFYYRHHLAFIFKTRINYRLFKAW